MDDYEIEAPLSLNEHLHLFVVISICFVDRYLFSTLWQHERQHLSQLFFEESGDSDNVQTCERKWLGSKNESKMEVDNMRQAKG